MARDHTLSFPLIAIAQWFAAESLIDGAPDPHELVRAPEELEDWRYPLSIATGTYSYDEVSRVLEPVLPALIQGSRAKWSRKASRSGPTLRWSCRPALANAVGRFEEQRHTGSQGSSHFEKR